MMRDTRAPVRAAARGEVRPRHQAMAADPLGATPRPTPKIPVQEMPARAVQSRQIHAPEPAAPTPPTQGSTVQGGTIQSSAAEWCTIGGRKVDVRQHERRARGLRQQAMLVNPIAAQAFLRRAAALELIAFAVRSSQRIDDAAVETDLVPAGHASAITTLSSTNPVATAAGTAHQGVSAAMPEPSLSPSSITRERIRTSVSEGGRRVADAVA